MFKSAILALILAAPLAAQSDPLAAINDGDRVEITLANGTVFRGEAVWCVEGRVKLDISLDTDTEGALVLEGKDIARAVRLDKLTAEQRDRILKEKEERRRKLLAEIAERDKAAAEAEAGPEPEVEAVSPGEKELLEKFPPGAWTPELRKALKERDPADLSDEEQEFLARYNDWKKAYDRVQRDKTLDRFSAANGWDEKRYADLVGRDPTALSADEAEFVRLHDQLVRDRGEKEKDDRASLLEEFPPGSQWNEEAYDRLKTQFIRISVPPTAREQKFIDRFDEWQQALKEREEKLAEEEELKADLKKEIEAEREKEREKEGTPPPK